MQKPSIALFSYNFPHKKTQDFIFRILSEGYKISVIYAANSVSLKIPASSIKSKINHIGLIHPEKIAKQFKINYKILDHNSQEIIQDAKDSNMLAIISGARILSEAIINCFPLGIINFHPGIIPYARGLDALYWSILNSYPLGVTAHLIDKRIDAGKILCINKIKIYKSDTLIDLSERLYEMQLEMLPSVIESALNKEGYLLQDYGNYNRKMNSVMEKEVLSLTPYYIKNWSCD